MLSLSVSDSKCSAVLICGIFGFVVLLSQVQAGDSDTEVNIREMGESPKIDYSERGRRIEDEKQKKLLNSVMSMLDNVEKVRKAFGINHPAVNKFDRVNRVITPAYEVSFYDGQQDPHVLVSHQNVYVAASYSDELTWAYMLKRKKQSWKVVEVSLREGKNDLRICRGMKQNSPIFLVDGKDELENGQGCGVYRLHSDGTVQQVIDIPPHSKETVLNEEGELPRYIKRSNEIADIRFFGWDTGYGLMQDRMRYDKKSPTEIGGTTRWMRYDKGFNRQWVKDLADPPLYFRPTGSRRFPVIGVTYGDEIFFPTNGELIRLQYPDDTVSTSRYPVSTRPFIPDSDFVALTTEGGNRLPVIDLRGAKPQINYSIEVGYPQEGNLKFPRLIPEHVFNIAPLVVGDRLYVTKGDSNWVSCYALTKEATPSLPLSKSRFDGPAGRDEDAATPTLLWRRYISGINPPRIARLGYYRGNIVVPGWGNIFFLDEDSGKVNYRFCTMYDPGQRIVPGSDWRNKAARLGMWNGIYRYTISGRYLMASTDNKREPTYIWRIPEINRRKPGRSQNQE